MKWVPAVSLVSNATTTVKSAACSARSGASSGLCLSVVAFSKRVLSRELCQEFARAHQTYPQPLSPAGGCFQIGCNNSGTDNVGTGNSGTSNRGNNLQGKLHALGTSPGASLMSWGRLPAVGHSGS